MCFGIVKAAREPVVRVEWRQGGQARTKDSILGVTVAFI
jgi:hypothetical protein